MSEAVSSSALDLVIRVNERIDREAFGPRAARVVRRLKSVGDAPDGVVWHATKDVLEAEGADVSDMEGIHARPPDGRVKELIKMAREIEGDHGKKEVEFENGRPVHADGDDDDEEGEDS